MYYIEYNGIRSGPMVGSSDGFTNFYSKNVRFF